MVRQSLRSGILSVNYWLKQYKHVTWLIGDGRSGTTWIANLINHNKYYREVFEPFHPWLNPRMSHLSANQYFRSNAEFTELKLEAEYIFTGKLHDTRCDEGNRRILYKGLLVKDIFANLLAHWTCNNFPEIKPILLVRNPFSVALSKQKKCDWHWMTEPVDFLKQTDLIEDYLSEYVDLIHQVSEKKDYIQNQILIWCIVNIVPLNQFSHSNNSGKKLKILFYEHVYNEPQQEMKSVFKYLGWPELNTEIELPDAVIHRPSKVVGKSSNIISGTSPISEWRNELDSYQIDAGYNILSLFGFDKVYAEDIPDKRAITDIY